MKPILIYGAYGYSGRLALLHARSLGLDILAAGRNAEKTAAVAREAECDYRVFSVEDAPALREGLRDVSVVLNCAGPFQHTADAIVRACLDAGIHYLDITGELGVIESMAHRDEAAKSAGVTLMPAAGFDVVPTDCMAAYLTSKLPDATHLELAFHAVGGLSHGTAQTMVESLGTPSAARASGRITPEPLGAYSMDVPFGAKRRRVISIPWGDVASAYYTTGIPNIRTFTTVPPRTAQLITRTQKFHRFLGIAPIRALARKLVEAKVTGPDEQARDGGKAIVWGRVTNDRGEVREANLHTIESYKLTYLTSVDLAQRAQAGTLPPGFQTPAGALGADYVCWLENTYFEDLSTSTH